MAAPRKKATKKKVAKKVTKKVTKKAPKKKAPAKKRPTRAAGAKRPSYRVSAAATKAMTKRKGLFMDLAANTDLYVRVMPRLDGEESIFAQTHLHYKMKGKDGADIALGCLEEHGDEDTGYDCYLCQLAEWLAAQEDKNLHKMGTGFGSIEAGEQLYIQAWVFEPSTKEWSGPRLVKCKPTIAGKLGDLIASAEDFGSTPFVDFDEGQIIKLTRTGSTKNDTRYEVTPTGEFISMDEVDEHWAKNAIKSLPAKLEVRVWDIDEQKQAAHRAFPDLPWDIIEEDIG